MIHPDVMQIAREEDLKAWRLRIRRQNRRRLAVRALYWAAIMALIGWSAWNAVGALADAAAPL